MRPSSVLFQSLVRGNWSRNKLDLDGDGNFTDPDELDEVRTHNEVNELEARDIDDDSSDDFNLTYDAVGNLTDDGEDYEYVYDGFGRLRKILDESDQSLIAEYRYNGLGHLTAVHEDTDDDDDVDGDDKWFYRMYDERWRWIGTFREDDTDPKEEFIPHQAGADGRGGSSYIDLVILRDRDGDNDDWTAAADGTMEERIYYCQNWRADVSAIVEDTGEMVEWVKYSAYGVPFGLPRGDTDSDGDCDQTDRDTIDNWTAGYDVLPDLNLDGTIDSSDESSATDATLSRGTLSAEMNTRSSMGIELACGTIRHNRRRTSSTEHGRWNSRDAMYIDGLGLYEISRGQVVSRIDPLGTEASALCKFIGCPRKCELTGPFYKVNSMFKEKIHIKAEVYDEDSSSGCCKEGGTKCLPCRTKLFLGTDLDPDPGWFKKFAHEDNRTSWELDGQPIEGCTAAENYSECRDIVVSLTADCDGEDTKVITATVGRAVFFLELKIECGDCPIGGGGTTKGGPSTPGPSGPSTPGSGGPTTPHSRPRSPTTTPTPVPRSPQTPGPSRPVNPPDSPTTGPTGFLTGMGKTG